VISCDSDAEPRSRTNGTRAVLGENAGWSVQYTFIANRGVEV